MDVKKRVLYLSYDGMTDPLGQSQVLPYLIGLQKKGYSFTLISFEKSDKYEKGKGVIQKIISGNQIEWHPLTYTKSPPILSTVKDLDALKRKITELHTKQAFDIVHCRSYITALAGLWMKKKWPVKFVFDMRGFWADERTDGKLWNLKNPIFKIVYRYFKKKEKQFLLSADYTISLTENGKKEIESWDAGKKFAPVQVIPCCVDIDLFDPDKILLLQIEKLKSKLNIQAHQKVLTYIGSLGTWYMLDEMMDFFKVFLKKHGEAVFLFVTKDAKDDIIRTAEKKQIPESALRIHSSEREQVPLFISVSDYSIFFIKPAFSKKASSPTKQGEIMAMGIPVICNDNVGDTSSVVNKYGSGLVVAEFSNGSYEKKLGELTNRQFNKQEIRKGAEDFFSLKNGIEKYASVYERITG